MGAWSEAIARVERWLLPGECLGCQARILSPTDPLVCAICRARWRRIPEPLCPTCGEPSTLGLACRTCAEWPPELDRVRSAVWFDGRVRPLIHHFKYRGWWRLAECFASAIAPLIGPDWEGDLVPVPLARRRFRERGFNQAERLASALSAITGFPLRPDRLRRVRETPTQTRLTPEGRLANLSGAFLAIPASRPAILVDDVFTTGATLISATSALVGAGASGVRAVTFARAEPPLAGVAALTIEPRGSRHAR